jgi:hypothetical protein
MFVTPRSSTNPEGLHGPRASAPETERVRPFECYCGFGPACPFFLQMTPEQRTLCSHDKRQTAQYYWRNGMG